MPFDQIPPNLRVPGAYAEIAGSGELGGFKLKPFRCLIVAQHLAASTPNGGNAFRVFSEADVEDTFGRGSIGHLMGRAWFAQNRTTEVWAIALDDHGSATDASGTITVTATSASAGTLYLYIGGQEVRVAVAQGDAQNAIATAIDAAINAKTDLPVTSSVATNVVTITARNGGEAGNTIRIHENLLQGQSTPAGVSLALVQLSGGTNNPDVSAVWAQIPATWFDVVVHPYTDSTNLAAIRTEQDARWDALVALDMAAIAVHQDTVANLLTFGDALNGEHNVTFGIEDSPAVTYELAAAAAARIARSAEQHPARPFEGLELVGLIPPPPSSEFSFAERDGLLNDGVSTFRQLAGRPQIERAISNRQTTDAGSPTVAWLDIGVHFTLSFMRWDWTTRLREAFQRYVIGDEGRTYDPSLAVVTLTAARDFAAGILTLWAENGILEDLDSALDTLVVQRNANEPGRIDFFVDVNLANGLQIKAAEIRYTV